MQTHVLELWERLYVRFMLSAKLDSLHGNSFEEFFLNLMCERNQGFFDIRTRGKLGDLGADGLMIDGKKLFACYGPQIVDEKKIQSKIESDLASAIRQRPGAFDTFVFVHSDRRGMDPVVSTALTEAKKGFTHISFENFGFRRFNHELNQLSRYQVEDLLGCEFPAKKVVTGVALKDVRPLLEHLARERIPHFGLGQIPIPSHQKMEFNEFSPDAMTQMTNAMAYVPCVETYYQNVVDPTERDDVAAGFREHYLMLAEAHSDPDRILEELIGHILGNEAKGFAEFLNALVVLMYFFGECDIFKMPPSSWPTIPELR
ncbi:ABC-three component system protein [Nonomuraea sp. NPDC050022]|uniref:ABC-three component system protein n=1 Tax=unclassified Nonomuraea TaxID=2593643 RepID=UPI0033FE435A